LANLIVLNINASRRLAILSVLSHRLKTSGGGNASFDKEMLNRLDQIEKLPAEEKQRIYHFMDLIIRDHAAKKAYSS